MYGTDMLASTDKIVIATITSIKLKPPPLNAFDLRDC